MQPLEALRHSRWSIEEFVEVVNRHLEQIPLLDTGRASVQQAVNARLVRHYTGAGLLDRPDREGKEARYGFRHLLQMLVLRRLLREGLTAQAIRGVTRSRSDQELEAFLAGGTRLTVEPANPALAFLEQIRERTLQRMEGEPVLGAATVLYDKAAPGDSPNRHRPRSARLESWRRIPLLEGLELHIRNDFEWPEQPRARAHLTRILVEVLENLARQERS